jgi:hypothetical protein
MNPDDDYVFDDDELVFTGKRIREYRDVCRKEGYKQAIEDVLNLPIKEFHGDFIKQVYKIKEELEELKE